jgi:hypothetical protein
LFVLCQYRVGLTSEFVHCFLFSSYGFLPKQKPLPCGKRLSTYDECFGNAHTKLVKKAPVKKPFRHQK